MLPTAVLRVALACMCVLLGVASSARTFVLTTTPENDAAVQKSIALYNAARQTAARGDKWRAIWLYEDAIEAYALMCTAYNNLGMLVYEVTGDRELALALLEKGAAAAAELNDTETVAATRSNMGYVTRDGRESSVEFCLRAIEFYDMALQAQPDFIDATYNKASALSTMRQLGDAQALLERVLQLNPNHVGANLDLGAIFYQRGLVDRAVHHQDAAIAHAPLLRTKIGAMHNKGHQTGDSWTRCTPTRKPSRSRRRAPSR